MSYYLIAVFDIRIAINARGSNGRGWRMLVATDLYPYTFEDTVRHLGHIFAVPSHGTCFIWLPSYGTGDYKRNAQTIICIPNDTPLFCRDQSSPNQNKIADPGCAFASVIWSNLEPCSWLWHIGIKYLSSRYPWYHWCATWSHNLPRSDGHNLPRYSIF